MTPPEVAGSRQVDHDITLNWKVIGHYEDGMPLGVDFEIVDSIDGLMDIYVCVSATGCIDIGTVDDTAGARQFHACSWDFLGIFAHVQEVIREVWPDGGRQ